VKVFFQMYFFITRKKLFDTFLKHLYCFRQIHQIFNAIKNTINFIAMTQRYLYQLFRFSAEC